MSIVLDLFLVPSAYSDNPRAWLGNALGHLIAVGLLSALWAQGMALSASALIIIPVIYALWEWAQWRWRGAQPWDCVQDWTIVTAGVAIGATFSPWIVAVAAGLICSDYLRRGFKE